MGLTLVKVQNDAPGIFTGIYYLGKIVEEKSEGSIFLENPIRAVELFRQIEVKPALAGGQATTQLQPMFQDAPEFTLGESIEIFTSKILYAVDIDSCGKEAIDFWTGFHQSAHSALTNLHNSAMKQQEQGKKPSLLPLQQ